jgi:sugar-specific transcriptional regulator TrmB
MDIKILQEVGLTKTESIIYLVLLDLGSSPAGEITKKSELNRTIVYYSLEKLIEKGLVTYVIEANRKVFQPVNPDRIIEILQEKQNNINKILPDLKSRYNEISSKSNAVIYRGKKGLKSVFEEILRTNQDYYIFGAEGNFEEIFPTYFHNWNNKRIKQKINVKVIYNENIREKRQGKLNLVEMKFLPKELDFPSTTQIFGNKVSIMVFADQPFAFIIESEDVVKSYKNFFKMLWKTATL